MLERSGFSRAPASVLAMLARGVPADGLIFAHTDAVVAQHRERQEALLESSNAILNRAEAEKRDLTVEEQGEIDAQTKEFDDLDRQIGLRERVANQASTLTAPKARQTDPDPLPDEDLSTEVPRLQNAVRPTPAGQPRVPAQPRVQARGNFGFRNMGDFALSVRNACVRGGDLDPRLRNAAVSTYGQEGVGADGGFAVPPDFRSDIMSKIFAEDSLIARTDRMQSSSNTITFPIDMTTPWQTTGGIQAYWVAEAATKTQSKPSLEEVTLKLSTLAALVPVTEELLEDAPAMDSYLRRKVPEKIDFKLSYSLAWGTGAGQPLGWMNSPALVTVAAESAQTATTINATNITKMLGRMPVQSRSTAVWLIHPDAEIQLPLMSIANQPIYLPPGGFANAPFGNLLGRPVIPHQIANSLGTLGDIMLVDLNQYVTVTKNGSGRDANGMRTDVSIHLWFDQDMVAFRFTVRVAGQPWWSASTPMRNGSNAMSPFVTLAAR
jgi:HK97 family phage major capsid protein